MYKWGVLFIKEKISIYIKQIGVAYDNKCNKMLKRYNITSSQFKVLLYLFKVQKETEVKQVDLERVFLLANPTMTGILQRLEKNGFIYRRKSEEDCRSNIIILGKKSLSIKDELIAIAATMESTIIKDISDSELKTAYLLLNKFLSNITKD